MDKISNRIILVTIEICPVELTKAKWRQLKTIGAIFLQVIVHL